MSVTIHLYRGSRILEGVPGIWHGYCSCGWSSQVGSSSQSSAKDHWERAHLGVHDAFTTNDNGGKQSDIEARFDLIDPLALRELARVLHEGAKVYGEGGDNWRRIPVNDHLNHAVAHVYRFLEGDMSEDHLPHAFCRLMFAVAMESE